MEFRRVFALVCAWLFFTACSNVAVAIECGGNIDTAAGSSRPAKVTWTALAALIATPAAT